VVFLQSRFGTYDRSIMNRKPVPMSLFIIQRSSFIVQSKTSCAPEATSCKLNGGSECGLVSAWDFKSYGSAYGGPVGSIPTHFRQKHRNDE
jgi:hypothetical protein